RDKGRVQCLLCPFECLLDNGKTGICGGKRNIDGSLIAINYALTTSVNLDPIEKKPLYHFHPGSNILSIGPNGCNFGCMFCQNYTISQNDAPTRHIAPEEAALMAKQVGSIGLAYTYAEPLIWFEYVMDASKAVRKAGMKNILVTNGYVNPEPLEEILPLIDAMNIDIKSMDPEFYTKICHGKLAPVLETVRRSAMKTHVEVTNLVIPGFNDSDEMFEKLTDFIAELNPEIPLHFSRYHPDYKFSAPATPYETLLRAVGIARKKLKFVYTGNVIQEKYNQTICPGCGETVIKRLGFSVISMAVKNGKCERCGCGVNVVGI
ncbi:MAG: AmmeMemoRadiSam system radical SAM enzyme, partial [Nitrospinae bacterium]|nr:AmmeMemoRadiSam system radical SAM enzyme [Nitrospinota bacterium]